MNIRRIQFGKWRFSYSFGRYGIGIHRQAKRAGSIAFGFGMVTYMKQGKNVPLRRGALFTR
jgi:hypothetical protein